MSEEYWDIIKEIYRMTEPLDIDDWSLYPLEDGTALLLKRLGKAETLDYQANYFMKVAELEKQKWR